MNRQKILITAVPIILVILVILVTRGGSEDTNTITVNPTIGPFRVTVTTTGELRALRNTPIMGPTLQGGERGGRGMMGGGLSGVSMTILSLVPEGTIVEEGDFVAELDRTSLQNQINDLLLNLETYENNIERTRLDCSMTLANARNDLVNLEFNVEEAKLTLEQEQFEAPSVVRQAEINLVKAERALNQARENYDVRVKQAEADMQDAENTLDRRMADMQQYYQLMTQFTVTAPADGMVIYYRERDGSKRVEGSSLNAFDPVIGNLPDLSTMETVTFVSEVDIQKVKVGQKVEIGVDAFPQKRLTGRITSVANIGETRANSDSKVFEVVIIIDGTDYDLRPAMTTSNTIIIADTTNVMYVPLEAVRSADTLTYVYKKGDSGKVRQEVELGLVNENAAVIDNGLTLADEVYLTTPEEADEFMFSYLQ